jgi:hypothetical protein
MPFFALEFFHSEKDFAYGVLVLNIFLLFLLLDIDETLVSRDIYCHARDFP